MDVGDKVNEIKPCPFCGSKDVFTGHRSSFYVHCDECQVDGPWNDRNEQEAIEAWNRRTPSASIDLDDTIQTVIIRARRVYSKFGADSDWSEWRDLGNALAELNVAPPLSSEPQAEKA